MAHYSGLSVDKAIHVAGGSGSSVFFKEGYGGDITKIMLGTRSQCTECGRDAFGANPITIPYSNKAWDALLKDPRAVLSSFAIEELGVHEGSGSVVCDDCYSKLDSDDYDTEIVDVRSGERIGEYAGRKRADEDFSRRIEEVGIDAAYAEIRPIDPALQIVTFAGHEYTLQEFWTLRCDQYKFTRDLAEDARRERAMLQRTEESLTAESARLREMDELWDEHGINLTELAMRG